MKYIIESPKPPPESVLADIRQPHFLPLVKASTEINAMKTTIIALLFILALVSCQKLADPAFIENKDIIGSWTNPQYSDTLITYSRTENLVENQFGITFKPGNKLVERQNSGFCGTPPITTADYEGTWIQKDSVVNISVGFWGGKAEYTWRIVSLNNQKLVISIVKADYSWGK